MKPELLTIGNDGSSIHSTNYWGSELEADGRFFMSLNAGTFRLLLPRGSECAIDEMKAAKNVVISRGVWPRAGLSDGVEILFDDRTSAPFALFSGVNGCDRLPSDSEQGKCGFTVWTWMAGSPECRITRPCWYRRVPSIPCLKPAPATSCLPEAAFQLGRVVITPAASEFVNTHQVDLPILIARHQLGDFGDMCKGDIATNLSAIVDNRRVLSSYQIGSQAIWIITEGNRSVTTILLPSDY